MDIDPWPLAHLAMRTENLELCLPDAAQLRALAALAADGVHDPGFMPFTQPWTRTDALGRARSVLQFHWRTLGELTAQDWHLPFVVLRDGVVVGSQSLQGKDFAITRQVSTGSWVGKRYHRQGIGYRMRAAVLYLAFAGLGATSATTSAHEDNPGSLGVTRKLGYRDNGVDVLAVEGARAVHRRFQLGVEDWRPPFDVELDGVAPCLALLGAEK